MLTEFDSSDAFYNRTSKEKANRSQLSVVRWICGANVVMLLSYAFGFYWWVRFPLVAIILGFVYVIKIFSSDMVEKDGATLFSDRYLRLRHWRDYYTSEYFIKTRDSEHAPISNGDYLWLWIGDEAEYLRYEVRASSYAKDVYFNQLYDVSIKLINPKGEKVKYSLQKSDVYGLSELLYEMQEQLKADGYIIKAVFNKFGDLRWQQSDNPKPPKKIRKLLYDIIGFGSGIAAFIAFVAPLVPVIKSIMPDD